MLKRFGLSLVAIHSLNLVGQHCSVSLLFLLFKVVDLLKEMIALVDPLDAADVQDPEFFETIRLVA